MMKQKIRIIYLLIVVLFGCQTPGYVIEESNYSVKQHRIAIVAALGQVKSVSPNGREILSYFHDRNLKVFEVSNKTKERLYTKVTILGVRRPYRVSVEVHVEQRDPDTQRFQDIGLDDRLGRRRVMAVKEMLNQSREDTATFDEQKPF